MPNRILREGWLDSDRAAALSYGAECQFVRLLLVADDFGRFDGRLSVIRARCWPLRREIEDAVIVGWLEELSAAGLASLYLVHGKPYLEIPNFRQRTRAQKSKFPGLDQADGGLSIRPAGVYSAPSPIPSPSPCADVGHVTGNGLTSDGQMTVISDKKIKEEVKRYVPPEWVPAGPWSAWLEVRPKVKAPNTPRALELAVKRLAELRDAGHDPAQILETATLRGWRGLFAPHDPKAPVDYDYSGVR